MIRVDVNHNLREIAVEIDKAHVSVRDKAAVRALNRAGVTVRAEASREITQIYNLKAATAKAQIRIVHASRARLKLELIASGRPIPLYQFDAKQRRKGLVSVHVRRDGPRKVVKGNPQYVGAPFVATMKSGHVGIFQRLTKRRLPIRELFSIDVPRAMTAKVVFEALERAALDAFNRNFEREVQYLLSKGS